MMKTSPCQAVLERSLRRAHCWGTFVAHPSPARYRLGKSPRLTSQVSRNPFACLAVLRFIGIEMQDIRGSLPSRCVFCLPRRELEQADVKAWLKEPVAGRAVTPTSPPTRRRKSSQRHDIALQNAHVRTRGVWRNGSASDSRSDGWEFESLCPHLPVPASRLSRTQLWQQLGHGRKAGGEIEVMTSHWQRISCGRKIPVPTWKFMLLGLPRTIYKKACVTATAQLVP